MFYPKLQRQPIENYHNANGKFYADYRRNYPKLEIDCCRRCVYCDVLLDEIGGEGMHVDHFRPKAHFEHLLTHPLNLVLSCPKCNGLKSDDWPAGVNTVDSYVGKIGYIDYFSHKVEDYLYVNEHGYVCEVKPPVSYIISRLDLNRKSRVLVRYKRKLNAKKIKVSEEITKLLEDLYSLMEAKKINFEDATARVGQITLLQRMLDKF